MSFHQEDREKEEHIFSMNAELCKKLNQHGKRPKVFDIGHLRRDHGCTMTTLWPISKSVRQRANRQTADGPTDRGGKEDRDRWSDSNGESDRGRRTCCPLEESYYKFQRST